MNILGIIPARYASARLPGKPLKDIEGKTMIRRVYEQCIKALPQVVVATDDTRIAEEVQKYGGTAVMTSPAHNTGTNRCREALDLFEKQSGFTPDVVVNIQGDEPLLNPEQIREITACFTGKNVEMASLALPLLPAETLHASEGVYVVMDKHSDALYFSRSVIPYVRDAGKEDWASRHLFYKHVGMYAYTPEALREFASLEQTPLEKAENLEQNRWLENGRKIRMGITRFRTIAVDTAEDLERVRKMIREKERR